MRLPDGYRVGHWTHPGGRTGCTVVLAPPGTRGGVEVRGGGTGTRELECLSPLANAEGPSAVLFTGGSAFGLAAADGVVRWHEERGLGRPTPGGVVPLVPTAVVYDLEPDGARPGPEGGYAACAAARAEGVVRGRVGAGAGAAVGKALGRPSASPGGVGLAAGTLGTGDAAVTVAAIAVVNAFGDVIDADGTPLASPRRADGERVRSAELIPRIDPPDRAAPEPVNTTLVCVCTDARLDKRGCGILARIATAGLARAVDPAFTPIDGDVVVCLASGALPAPAPGAVASWQLTATGTLVAGLTAAAIRDAVRAGAA